MIWNNQTLRHWAICLVCLCVYIQLRQKAAHSWLLELPAKPLSVYHERMLAKTQNKRNLQGKKQQENNEWWNRTERVSEMTSCVQTGCSLAAVQLPLFYFEVGAGPLQTSMAPKFGEKLQDGPRTSRNATGGAHTTVPHHWRCLSYADIAAPVPGPRSHHLNLSRDTEMWSCAKISPQQ